MKLSRSELKSFIVEAIREKESVLLEMPQPPPIVGQEQSGDHDKDSEDYDGEMAKRSLFHMSQQAQQLHDMLLGDENLEPWVSEKISLAADYLEKAFKAIIYDKSAGKGL